MAGIGFRLQKLLEGDTYTDVFRAYVYASIISAGPLIFTVAAIALIGVVSRENLTLQEQDILRGLIVYVFAFSLIGVGMVQLVATRYVADRMFLRDDMSLVPSFLSVIEFVFIFQAIVALIALSFSQFSLPMALTVYILYLFVCGIWLSMIFLSAAYSYKSIVWSFVTGCCVSFVAAFFWGKYSGLMGYLLGFTLGQGLTFLLLCIRVFVEFGYYHAFDFNFIKYFFRYPALFGIGVFYYWGIWIDKFVFWFSDVGRELDPILYLAPQYDAPIFVAYLTILPAMSYFLMKMETQFFVRYQKYFAGIISRLPLEGVRRLKIDMIDNLRDSFQKVILLQGIVSLMALWAVPWIIKIVHLNSLQIGVLRIGILGAFLQGLLLILMNIYFYFEFYREALWVSIIFFLLNGILTLLSIKIGLAAYGYGYTGACFLSLIFAYLLLDSRLKDLEYWTFMTQPIYRPRLQLEAEQSK
ncbi:MAG: hypothetical protein A3F89_01250 [Deltaproteobacteria bacterium RIFCSPLOWO2_12_FULL_50_11]|nr:MAG: hypothetical protein A3F89_01250 [Deltaproteobacteria bacterium RIFCSPLOWO2_12_FULL_50_11]